MNKKKIIATASAVALAAVLAFGGTLAYLNDTSVTATNEVDNNFNWVKLTETEGDPQTDEEDGNITNTGYEIIPGTSQEKDPTVSVSYSVDSYVYVTVEDTSGGLITWTPADGWTLLESASDTDNGYYVYYRLVNGTEDDAEEQETNSDVTYYKNSFSVLDGDSISYSSSITNSDLATFDEDGDPDFLNDDIKLTFQAYIMQAQLSDNSGIVSAAVAYSVLNGGTYTETTISSDTASSATDKQSAFNAAASEDNTVITVTTTVATSAVTGMDIITSGNVTISGDDVTVNVDGTYALANKLTVTGSDATLSGPNSGYGPTSATVYRGVTVTGEDASLTIESGTYKQDAAEGKVITATNGATVTINGGTYASSGSYVTVFYANGGTIYIENVNSISASGANSVWAAAENGGTIYISSAVYNKYTNKFSAAGAVYDSNSGYYVITSTDE